MYLYSFGDIKVMNALLNKLIFAIFFISGCLLGCSGSIARIENEISPKELTNDQKDIVNLFNANGQEILLFDYKTQETYKSVEFWVEIYEDGVFVSRSAGLHQVSDEAKPVEGQLAVLITQNLGFQWVFSTNGSSHANSEPYIIADDTLARAYGPINEPLAIQDGKEIVLYTSIFSYGNIAFLEHQSYTEQPELINNYPFVQFIKCKFSK